MTTKLVSANMGIVLVVEKNGKQERKEFNCVLPSKDGKFSYPLHGIQELCDFLNDEFGTEYVSYDSATNPKEIKIARPAKIKARPAISQAEFNKKIKELVP